MSDYSQIEIKYWELCSSFLVKDWFVLIILIYFLNCSFLIFKHVYTNYTK